MFSDTFLLITYYEPVFPDRTKCDPLAPLQLLDCFTSIGFSLTNGTIAMKVIRICYIHNRPKLNKKLVSSTNTNSFFTLIFIIIMAFPQAIRDVHIFVAIMILVGLDIIIIGLYLLIGANRENPIELIGVCAWFHPESTW